MRDSHGAGESKRGMGGGRVGLWALSCVVILMCVSQEVVGIETLMIGFLPALTSNKVSSKFKKLK